jgi:hypothetical protein
LDTGAQNATTGLSGVTSAALGVRISTELTDATELDRLLTMELAGAMLDIMTKAAQLDIAIDLVDTIK